MRKELTAARPRRGNARALTLRCEALQADAVAGVEVDSEELTRLANRSARVLQALKRGRPTPRGETPSLEAYMMTRGAVETMPLPHTA
jgi:hypothetical protein